ncbi:hypothetical protein B0T16DRAFT_75220 [Cercophora newfieldiana]|uniref:Uncharacterized protein n=1 Tax=Cercophora newfieldiana TaxID=92897 RepID=A0AA40CW06_9PEZI|nr:hypothetical protein B0T16DRAFT_75220 [Cercophora newfieldiana]
MRFFLSPPPPPPPHILFSYREPVASVLRTAALTRGNSNGANQRNSCRRPCSGPSNRGSPTENMFTNNESYGHPQDNPSQHQTPQHQHHNAFLRLTALRVMVIARKPIIRIGHKMENDLPGMKSEMEHHVQLIGVISDVAIYPAHPSSPIELSPTSPRNSNSNSRLPSRFKLLLSGPGLPFRPHRTAPGQVETPPRSKKQIKEKIMKAISNPRH